LCKKKISLCKTGKFIWEEENSEYQSVCLIEEKAEVQEEPKKRKHFCERDNYKKTNDIFDFEPLFERPPPPSNLNKNLFN